MIINTELILAILGIITTIIIGICAVRYASKVKIKTQLLFFEHNCISLFKSIVKELDDIEIKYKNKIIGENLIMFKGTFFNSGNADIDKTMVHKPLLIKLPEDYIWTKAKIVDKSNDVVIKESIDNNQLIFNWDILKENEYFTFDSIIEYKPDPDKDSISDDYDITRKLSRNISFNHRITNLKSINKERLPSKPMGFIGMFFLSLYMLCFVGLGLHLSAGQFVFPDYDLQFKIQRDSTTSYAKLEAINKDEIKLTNKKENTIFTVKNAELYQLLRDDIKIVKQGISYWKLVLGGLFAVLMLFVLIFVINETIGDKKLYKRIKTITDKHSNLRLDIDYRRKGLGMFPFE